MLCELHSDHFIMWLTNNGGMADMARPYGFVLKYSLSSVKIVHLDATCQMAFLSCSRHYILVNILLAYYAYRLASTPAMFNSTLTEDDAYACPVDGSIMITGAPVD